MSITKAPFNWKRPNPIEIAHSLKSELDQLKVTQEELANILHKKRSTIANYLRLLKLPQEIQTSLEKGEITMGHAKSLAALSKEEQKKQWKAILDKKLTVRDLEKKLNGEERNVLTPEIKDLEKWLESRFGTKVSLKEKSQGEGSITFEYFSLNDLDRLLNEWGRESEN